MTELDALLQTLAAFMREFGIVLALLLTFAYLVVHRRTEVDENGRKRHRSAYLVPGYQYDALADELLRSQLAFEARLADVDRDMDVRLAEWRRLRDEERARAIESDERLRQTVDVLRELAHTIGEARLEVARLAGIRHE